MIGLLVASAGDPLRSFLVEYLDRATVKIGCHTIIGNTVTDPHQFDYYIEEFARRGMDGIFCVVPRWYEADRAALQARHPNTVFYNDPHVPGCPRDGGPGSGHAHGGAAFGPARRRRIGLALMNLSEPTHAARLRGYEAELAAHGLPRDPGLVFDGENFGLLGARCNDTINKWEFPAEVMGLVIDRLVRDHSADAIIAHDDFWAATLVKFLRARGIGVPHDVAVVGYLNHYLADWTDPALTTIDLQHKMAANAMVEMVEEMIRSGPLPEERRVVTIKPKLVVREST